MLYLFFIAFGFTATPSWIWIIVQCVEIFYFVEIVTNFLKSYTDLDNNNAEQETVVSIKKIAYNYITKGSFIVDVLAFIPFNLFYFYED